MTFFKIMSIQFNNKDLQMSILFCTFVISKETNNAKVKLKNPDRWAKRQQHEELQSIRKFNQ